TDGAHREELVRRAASEFGRLDVLVNNAGRGFYAGVAAARVSDVEELFALNVVAPLHLAQLALPMLRDSRGTIVMMSSVAGVVAAPRMGAYAASKFALEALSMSLRAELAAEAADGRPPVRVLVVRPGPVDTPFRDNAVTDRAQSEGGAAKEPGVRPRGANVQSPAVIAERTVRAVERGEAVVETSLFVRVASMAARVAPALFRRISASMARER
ncbi:SDR family NAD(P)-dependent oxidoreductase, partial [bacterium]